MIDDGLTALVGLATLLIGGWFATRVHKLEERVDVLEDERDADRSYIAKLRNFIYKLGETPPVRDQE